MREKGWMSSRPKVGGEYFENENGPIKLESCPRNGKKCQDQRTNINACLLSSFAYFSDRQYRDSIDELKVAYHKTFEITESPCVKCANLFRQRIMQSLEQVENELQQMSSGLFWTKRHKPNYEYANSTIRELKNED